MKSLCHLDPYFFLPASAYKHGWYRAKTSIITCLRRCIIHVCFMIVHVLCQCLSLHAACWQYAHLPRASASMQHNPHAVMMHGVLAGELPSLHPIIHVQSLHQSTPYHLYYSYANPLQKHFILSFSLFTKNAFAIYYR